MVALRELRVLVVDCQAGGATPAYGDLLELGWAVTDASALLSPLCSHWITPRTERPIPRAVRELTGWSKACLDEALPEEEAWARLRRELTAGTSAMPTVIHYARFELPFLRDLSARLDEGADFPIEVVDLHAVAARLYPDLPRRNIRALAGFLGHAPELMRRAAGHVEATAFIWRALVPVLEAEQGITTWPELLTWLDTKSTSKPRSKKRIYPLSEERRKALPDKPGVYRFLRRSGDIIYVGKAASLKKRVASHFASGARTTEKNLEMLTQVHDIDASETASVLEAALLETDEIKRLDPPYNVQLRSGERSAWFLSRDLLEAVAAPDARHRVGPVPSERALSPLAALSALAGGMEPAPRVLANALAVSTYELPEPALFEEGFRGFVAEILGEEGAPARRVEQAALRLWRLRGRKEVEVIVEDDQPTWDLARVRRRLERNLIQSGLLLRRGRWLCLLVDADVAYRERTMSSFRVLRLSGSTIEERLELPGSTGLSMLAPRPARSLSARQRSFDAAGYDRLRVLATELRRVLDDKGEVALRVGKHVLHGERLARMMSDVY